MPKMTLTEDEASHIRKQREVKAMQAVAWNEAIDQCIVELGLLVTSGDVNGKTGLAFDGFERLKRNPAKPT